MYTTVHTRNVCAGDAAHGVFFPRPGTAATAKCHLVGQCLVPGPGDRLPECVLRLYH